MTETISEWFFWYLGTWADATWLLLVPFAVHKGQLVKAIAFVAVCMIVMRLQIEIVQSFGFDQGFTGLMTSSLYHRGLLVYGIFTGLYLLLSWLSPGTKGAIYLAASLSIFFMAFTISSILMII